MSVLGKFTSGEHFSLWKLRENYRENFIDTLLATKIIWLIYIYSLSNKSIDSHWMY